MEQHCRKYPRRHLFAGRVRRKNALERALAWADNLAPLMGQDLVHAIADKALEAAKEKVRELFGELFEDN